MAITPVNTTYTRDFTFTPELVTSNYKQKYQSLNYSACPEQAHGCCIINSEAELVVEEVEKVANAIEKVAMIAEKVSEEVAEKLPEDGKLKKAALVVERLSKQAAHDAELTIEFIHKVDEFKNDLDDLESFIAPIVDKIVKKESERK
ncbi:uncharacterized protein LOC113852035 [Abrus precatorius]|uniref:Uncharacterized protein LOC113852035 n=1 Tax=Abrus precatorius TaxID=3816 RepID=A0A8B8K2Z3_ABRPR|nr:uncharacterized protein LOC113852035 [Abrus precatorius]